VSNKIGGFPGDMGSQALKSYAKVTRLWGGLALAVVACRGEEVIGHGRRPPPASSGGSAGTAPGSGGSETGLAGSGGDSETAGGGMRAGGSGQTGESGGAAGRAASGNGGAAGTGGLGQGGEPDLPLPNDCTTRDVYEGIDDCVVGLACDTTWTNGSCHRLPSGSWECSCEVAPAAEAMEGGAFEPSDRVYELTGAPGLAACAVAAGLCSIDESELDFGEESCGPPTDVSGPDDCEGEVSCTRRVIIPFAPSVVGRVTGASRADCTRMPNGNSFDCTCGNAGVERSDTVIASDAASVCAPYLEWCIDTQDPTFDGPSSCSPTGSSANGTECSAGEVCASSIRLTDEVGVAAEASSISANCTLSTGTYCSCIKDSTAIFSFNVELDPTAGTCEMAARACEPDVIEAQGPPSCIPAPATNAGQDVCDRTQYCDVPATVGGQDIVTRIRPAMTCRRADAAGPWWCACVWNRQSVTFELGQTGAGAEQACEAGGDQCLALLPIVLGPGPDGEIPPNPLPPP
jgi:hypothetical protein